MRLGRDIFSLTLLQGSSYAIPLVSVPYLVRILGADAFGRAAFALACAQYFVLFIEYGFQLSATRRSALLREDRFALAQLAAAVMCLRCTFCAAGFLLVLAITAWLPPFTADRELYLLAYVTAAGAALFPGWLLQGLGRIRTLTLCGMAGQACYLIGLFALVRDEKDLHAAVALQGMAVAISAMLAWAYLVTRRQVALRLPQRAAVRDALREGWPLFLSNASVSLYTTSNTVLLGLVAGAQAVGYFAAAEKLVRAIQALLAPVSQVTYPHVARLVETSRSQGLAFLRRMLQWQGLATLLLSALLFLAGRPVVLLLYGEALLPAAEVLRWLAALPFVVGLSNVLGVQAMLNFGMGQVFSRILMACGGLNVLLVLWLGASYGATGAAAAVVLTEVGVVGTMSLMLWRGGLLREIVGWQRP